MALQVVGETANTPSSRSFDHWTPIYRSTVSNPTWGENMWRALYARVSMQSTDPRVALMLEAAWLAYKRKRQTF